MHDILLGYGDPSAAHYKRMPIQEKTLNFNDTFLDLEHLRESFTDYTIEAKDGEKQLSSPLLLSFQDVKDIDDDDDDEDEEDGDGDACMSLPKVIKCEQGPISNCGPYPYDEPKKNAIRFTPTQIEAIRSGMQHGLTLVVGPPGK